jgi:hypothetical protein
VVSGYDDAIFRKPLNVGDALVVAAGPVGREVGALALSAGSFAWTRLAVVSYNGHHWDGACDTPGANRSPREGKRVSGNCCLRPPGGERGLFLRA